MKDFDLCIATDYSYDSEFIEILEQNAGRCGLSLYQVWPRNLKETLDKLREGSLSFSFIIDRASTTSPEFIDISDMLLDRGADFLDPPSAMILAADKARMHGEFISHNIRVPMTCLLPPFSVSKEISLSEGDLDEIGIPFIIKPAVTTGGGNGVYHNGLNLQDVERVRMEYPEETYLVQRKILPKKLDARIFWFRVFFICGDVFTTWWDDKTHEYSDITDEQTACYDLYELSDITRAIAAVCGLRFFSTEIARTESGEFLVIDYVNEACDLRMQSRHVDGVPDHIVHSIAEKIMENRNENRYFV